MPKDRRSAEPGPRSGSRRASVAPAPSRRRAARSPSERPAQEVDDRGDRLRVALRAACRGTPRAAARPASGTPSAMAPACTRMRPLSYVTTGSASPWTNSTGAGRRRCTCPLAGRRSRPRPGPAASRRMASSPLVVEPPAECPTAATRAGSMCPASGSPASDSNAVITADASSGWLPMSARSTRGTCRLVFGYAGAATMKPAAASGIVTCPWSIGSEPSPWLYSDQREAAGCRAGPRAWPHAGAQAVAPGTRPSSAADGPRRGATGSSAFRRR